MAIQFNTKLTRYVISGTTSTAVNLATTWALERLGMHYITVVTLAFMFSVLVSFLLQKFFTFSNRTIAGTHSQFAMFVVIAGVNLAVNDGLVHVQYDLLQIRHLVVVQAIASAVIAVYSYFVYRHLFGRSIHSQTSPALNEQP